MNKSLEYSFCETVSAQAMTPWHIRPLTNVGQKLGGGADTPALCGRAVAWDLNVPITMHHLEHCCVKCKVRIMNWTYGVLRPNCDPDMVTNLGPLIPKQIREILGGDYELFPIMRGEALAALVDRDGLPPNHFYQGNINGPVILGKMAGEEFVGALGVPSFPVDAI